MEKKAENNKLLEQEEAQLVGNRSAVNTSNASKITRHDILVAQQQQQYQGQASCSSANSGGVQSGGDEEFEVERNMNREIGINDTGAKNVDEAIALLTLAFLSCFS